MACYLGVENALGTGVVVGSFVGQQRNHSFLEGSEATLDFAFGLGAGSDQVGDSKGRKGALEFGAGIAIIGHGVMTEKAKSIGVNGHGQLVLGEETAKVFKMVPGGVGGDKGGT